MDAETYFFRIPNLLLSSGVGVGHCIKKEVKGRGPDRVGVSGRGDGASQI